MNILLLDDGDYIRADSSEFLENEEELFVGVCAPDDGGISDPVAFEIDDIAASQSQPVSDSTISEPATVSQASMF